MSNLLEKTRKVNKVLQLSGNNAVSFEKLSEILSEVLECNVYIADINGNLLGYSFTKGYECELNIKTLQIQGARFPQIFNEELLKINETVSNLREEVSTCVYNNETICKFNARYNTYVTINGGGNRLGTLVLARFKSKFIDEDLVLAEISATVIGVEMIRTRNNKLEQEERLNTIVQMALGTLSYSEFEAVNHIFKELDGNEGLLVASKIADRVGITRSVIVNALRKFESAGIIETRSLGMKGTYIKILNPKLINELERHNN